jgi:hypothetical protein
MTSGGSSANPDVDVENQWTSPRDFKWLESRPNLRARYQLSVAVSTLAHSCIGTSFRHEVRMKANGMDVSWEVGVHGGMGPHDELLKIAGQAFKKSSSRRES